MCSTSGLYVAVSGGCSEPHTGEVIEHKVTGLRPGLDGVLSFCVELARSPRCSLPHFLRAVQPGTVFFH